MEIWLGTFPTPGRTAALARMAEEQGWDGLAYTDSQNLTGDPFSGMCLAAQATKRLKLSTGATNPTTRHPAVVASAISTVQVESGGRAMLGIARGDSALAYLGRKPTPLAEFRRGIEQVQTYLRGESVELDGYSSRIEWLPQPGIPKVPMSIAATGPKVIQIAAELSDRITFSVGASMDRLKDALAQARAIKPNISCGAYINSVAHPDKATARELVRGRLSVYARFSSMSQSVRDALPEADRAVTEQLGAGYDMHAHGISRAQHTATMDDDFIDRFGVVGPSDYVVERLQEIAALGLDHLIIVGHSRDVDPAVFEESSKRFATEVIPRLH